LKEANQPCLVAQLDNAPPLLLKHGLTLPELAALVLQLAGHHASQSPEPLDNTISWPWQPVANGASESEGRNVGIDELLNVMLATSAVHRDIILIF
jgi:hypothetical protein